MARGLRHGQQDLGVAIGAREHVGEPAEVIADAIALGKVDSSSQAEFGSWVERFISWAISWE